MKKRNKFFVILGVLLLCIFFNASVSSDNSNLSNVTAASPCRHPYYVDYGTGMFVKEKYNNNSTYCYRTTTAYKQRCGKCGYKISALHYGSWTKHKHNYGFLGLKKECKECGHKK